MQCMQLTVYMSVPNGCWAFSPTWLDAWTSAQSQYEPGRSAAWMPCTTAAGFAWS